MSEVIEHTYDLVDHASIEAHQRKVAALRVRVAQATETLRSEEAVHRVAEASYRKAVAAASADRHEQKSALDASASRLVVESESADAARSAFEYHRDFTPKVIAMAHRPMYEDGIRRRLEASKAGDRARAALTAAADEYLAASEQMRTATQSGLHDAHGALSLGTGGFGVLTTYTQERKIWTDRRVDPANPKHPWVA